LTVVLDLLEPLIAAVAAFARLLTSVLSGEGEVRGHGFLRAPRLERADPAR
jgi:hypothetical protein